MSGATTVTASDTTMAALSVPGIECVRCRKWYTKCGTEYASHDSAATRANTRVDTMSAANVNTNSERFSAPTSRIRCSL